jgi:hypothetical protein
MEAVNVYGQSTTAIGSMSCAIDSSFFEEVDTPF